MSVTRKSAVILFDGVCNFCNGRVNFIIKHDADRIFKFAALQSEAGQKLVQKYGLKKLGLDTIILIENGHVYTHSTAALRIAYHLGGIWSWAHALIYVPKVIRDLFYKLFARNRYRLFGKTEQCMIPTPEIRERFLGQLTEEGDNL